MKEETDNFPSPDLLCRNQFILGPSFHVELKSWQQISINGSIKVTSHPDLNIYQVIAENKSITLLGHILDPHNPHFGNADIVDNLLNKLSRCADFSEHTYSLGGRWILIVNDGKGIRLFHDALGLRQVFYTEKRYTKELWCASQPGLIADVLNLQMDREALDFIHSYSKINDEYWWPGNSSPYKEIVHLLPNHSLDVETGLCKRYWPDRDLGRSSLDEAVNKVSGTLQGMMEAASHRFDLALGLTAGWDTRVVLAASRGIRDKISYMTVKERNMSEDHADIEVPALLLSKLGLRHEVLNAAECLDAGFEAAYKKSVTLAHDVWAPDAQAIFSHYRLSKVAITGSASETVRSPYPIRKKSKNGEFTAHGAATYRGILMGESAFAINHLERWLSELGPQFNLDIDHLFYWEQRSANWLAMCQLEFDSAWKDIFTPFNCRNLLLDMLSVEEKHREKPTYEFYRRLMLKMWPEVLRIPINPHKKKGFSTRMTFWLSHQISPYLSSSLKKSLKKYLARRKRKVWQKA
jgi:hypothetical protein